MKRLITLLAICALGSSGAAFAQNLLTNGAAETGDLTGWTVDLGSPAALADCGFVDPTVDGGTYSFSLDQCNTVPGTFDGFFYYSQISQVVDTTGCNVATHVGELTGGTYGFSTRYEAGGDDEAIFGLTFYDAAAAPLSSSSTTVGEADNLFHSGGFSGAIPAGAATAEVTLGGRGIPGGDTNPGIYHDNVSYSFTSCIAAYAVTAGKTTCTGGNESNGGGDGNGQFIPISDCDGQNGTPAFGWTNTVDTVILDGAVFVEAQMGLMDGTGTGSPETFPYSGTPSPGSYVMIKAKVPNVQGWCRYTPSGASGVDINAADYVLTGIWAIECWDDDGDYLNGFFDANAFPVGAVNQLGGKGRDKDRGVFFTNFALFPLNRGFSDTFEN